MTRFTDRVARDLSQIADQASPSSPTAWESIRQRVADQADASTMEVIMLTPNDNDPTNRSRIVWLVAASVVVIALVGGLVAVANRDTAENLPADQPVSSTPSDDPTPIDGERDGEPDSESTTQSGDVLPDVEPIASGQYTMTCDVTETMVFAADDVGTAPQRCALTGDPLPIDPVQELSLELYRTDAPTVAFTVRNDDGYLSAGYTYTPGAAAPGDEDSVDVARAGVPVTRAVGLFSGTDRYAGETITAFIRSQNDIDLLVDWTVEPDLEPRGGSEPGAMSAELTMECEATFVGQDVAEQRIEQACTFTGDDERFVPAPQTFDTRLFSTDGEPIGSRSDMTSFVVATNDNGFLFSGIASDASTFRAVGVRPGTGEFAGLLIHDVYDIEVDDSANATATVHSSVSPDET